MLDECAPGHTVVSAEHNHRVDYHGRTFPQLPVGKHGARANPEVKLGHIKQMVRQLLLDVECVRRHLPQLQLPKPPREQLPQKPPA